jgi:hypothetical protein
MGRKYSAHGGGIRTTCPHAKCPYTVLDKYDTYEAFMESDDSKINIAGLKDADWSAGRITPCARLYFPLLLKPGKYRPF